MNLSIYGARMYIEFLVPHYKKDSYILKEMQLYTLQNVSIIRKQLRNVLLTHRNINWYLAKFGFILTHQLNRNNKYETVSGDPTAAAHAFDVYYKQTDISLHIAWPHRTLVADLWGGVLYEKRWRKWRAAVNWTFVWYWSDLRPRGTTSITLLNVFMLRRNVPPTT